MATSFPAVEAKMRAAGLGDAAVAAFRLNYDKLLRGESGMLPESALDAVTTLPRFDADVVGFQARSVPSEKDVAGVLRQTVVLKLNGGLGTSMGLEKAKSLLPVKDGETFLTLIAKQVKHLRAQYPSANVKFMLMNSFSTSEDTMAALRASGHADLADEPDVELMQNKSPKVRVDDFSPVAWEKDPELEWCPPGHGDLYAALLGSGTLQRLVDAGYRYAFVSNSDNLGATLDVDLLCYFAKSGKHFLMEVAERTEADKKGGHLALHKGTTRMVLRESAMCPKEDTDAFQDIKRHGFFNTNNIWLDLVEVLRVMKSQGGAMPLPLIKNKKTVDPRDPSSTPVFQLETAMGAAIESFENAGAIVVPRSRFAPVKTTSDLFALRSDAYVVTPDFRIELTKGPTAKAPIVALDDKFYKLVDQMDALVLTPPSLVDCEKLVVSGPAKFASKGVVFRGTCAVTVDGAPVEVPRGEYVSGAVCPKPT